jgi:hypothetical protein
MKLLVMQLKKQKKKQQTFDDSPSRDGLFGAILPHWGQTFMGRSYL